MRGPRAGCFLRPAMASGSVEGSILAEDDKNATNPRPETMTALVRSNPRAKVTGADAGRRTHDLGYGTLSALHQVVSVVTERRTPVGGPRRGQHPLGYKQE